MHLPSVETPSAIQLWQWITNPVKYLHNCDRQYGDIFTIHMSKMFKDIVFISHPAAIQQLLTSDTKQFAAPGAVNQILKPFLGDRGVIFLDGQEHRQRRQLVMPAFHGEKIRITLSRNCRSPSRLPTGAH